MSQPPATDPDLMRGLRAGRSDAFERVYADYRAPIYNLCARILGDREEARDVTQEVFIKAFGKLSEPGDDLKLRPWLYRVATNACFNLLRSRKHLDGGGDAQLATAASRVDEFERARTAALVEQSLGMMNERYRTALVLKDLQGLPPEEIAEVLDISRPTADVLVHRARASFKAVFMRLVGDKVAAPAALGLVLLPLSLPAALHAMPPLPAGLGHGAPAPHAPAPAPHGLHLPDLSSAAAPAGAGLLTKIGAALATKAGITGAAATLLVGGGAAVYEVRSLDAHHAPAAQAHPARQVSAWKPATRSWLRRHAASHHHAPWAGHGGPMGEHLGHHAGPSQHDASHMAEAAHDSTHHASMSGSGGDGHSSAGMSSTSAPTGHHTSDGGGSSGSHESGGMSGDHESGGGM